MTDLFVRRTAVWSSELTPLYRYRLDNIWNGGLPILVAIMLNPSTADETNNDPTVSRIEKRAQRLGFGGYVIMNAFAWRATDPADMKSAADPIGPDNDRHIREVLRQAKSEGWMVLAGWGNHGDHLSRDRQMIHMFREVQMVPMCLAVTQSGQPGHPLYLNSLSPMIPWEPVS